MELIRRWLMPTLSVAVRYDIAQLGMTTAQCREALDAIGLPHVEVPAGPIDLAKFKSLVPEAV